MLVFQKRQTTSEKANDCGYHLHFAEMVETACFDNLFNPRSQMIIVSMVMKPNSWEHDHAHDWRDFDHAMFPSMDCGTLIVQCWRQLETIRVLPKCCLIYHCLNDKTGGGLPRQICASPVTLLPWSFPCPKLGSFASLSSFNWRKKLWLLSVQSWERTSNQYEARGFSK